MKFKQIVVLGGVILAIFTSGCQSEFDSSGKDIATSPSQSTAETTTVNTYHETIPVPENGWTADLINEVLYINGKNISIPFTIEDLGEGFEWEVDSAFTNEEGKIDSIPLYYNSERFAFVTLINPKYGSELNSAETKEFVCVYKGSEQLVFLNGITIGSTYDEVIKAFGETYVSQEEQPSFIKYLCSDVDVFFSTEDDKVESIWFRGK